MVGELFGFFFWFLLRLLDGYRSCLVHLVGFGHQNRFLASENCFLLSFGDISQCAGIIADEENKREGLVRSDKWEGRD